MMRAGWEVPSINSPCCSLDWMQGVRSGYYYCPKAVDIKVTKRCFAPPPKVVLMDKIRFGVRSSLEVFDGRKEPYENTVNWLEKHPADVSWLVKGVAIIDEDDEIFEKSYKYIRQKDAKVEPIFDNEDGFWDVIPPLTE